MKKETTIEWLRNNFKNIIVVPYEALHFGLSYKQPEYYNAGVYGWNYDAYMIDYETIIITGCIPIKGTIKLSRKKCKEFDEFIRINRGNIDYEEHEKLIENFVMKHIREA